MAFSPFGSLPSDYYEMGSILVARIVASLVPGFVVERWRNDDLVKLVSALARNATVTDAAGVAASLLIGVALEFATYWAVVLVSGQKSPPPCGALAGRGGGGVFSADSPHPGSLRSPTLPVGGEESSPVISGAWARRRRTST